MTVIGYARVSTTDQDLTIQEAALKAAGCEVIRAEKRSGTTTQGREEFRTVLDFLRMGDVLMVTRIDRLARSIGDLQDIVRTVRARGASLKATEQPIDTAHACSREPRSYSRSWRIGAGGRSGCGELRQGRLIHGLLRERRCALSPGRSRALREHRMLHSTEPIEES
jgi:hypothetical protein